jgi:putative ABC transport system permease protein
MLRNFVIIALRNLRRDFYYNFINILGLTIGISSGLLLLMFILDDLSYDRFHRNHENIYRIGSRIQEPDDAFSWAVCPFPMAPQLKEEYPQVKDYLRMVQAGRNWYRYGDGDQYIENKVFYADSTFFSVFSYELLSGNAGEALNRPNTMVLTKSMAEKYFGNEDPVGKVLQREGDRSYEITGVMSDVPRNTHIRFDALITSLSIPRQFGSWGTFGVYTYVVLEEGTPQAGFEALLPSIYEKYQTEIFKRMGIAIRYEALPIARIHLFSDFEGEPEPLGSMSYIYIFLAVIVLMLLLASLNYMNLAVARSMRRNREVVIRKVVGADRRGIVLQFLTESMAHAGIAMLVSLLAVYLVLPFFGRISGKLFDPAFIFQPEVLLSLAGLALITGLAGGSYPAFYLARFNPIGVLQARVRAGSHPFSLRKVLVVLQFTISTFMMISTWLVYNQLNHLKTMETGFTREGVVRLQIFNPAMQPKIEVLKQKILESPAIERAGTSSANLGNDSPKAVFTIETDEGMAERGINFFMADYDFLETAGIVIEKGRGFSREFLSDTTRGVLVNEVLARRLNWEEPLGKKVQITSDSLNPAQVVGVIRNFRQTGMYNEMESLLLRFRLNNPVMYIRVKEGQMDLGLRHIERSWEEVFPQSPFDYRFLDDEFSQQFSADEKRAGIFTFFSILTALIACLGLFALAAYMVARRTREICIRKVMGAGRGDIVRMVIGSYTGLVLIAIVLAVAGGVEFSRQWQERFVNKADFAAEAFVIPALLTIVLTVITVSYHALKASATNPADVLKDE